MQVYETERLRVRHLEEVDFADLYAICRDPLVMRYMGDGNPLTEEQTALWIQKSQANYAHHGYGCMAVVDKAGGAFIGFCGLVYAPGSDEVEIIYALAQPYWGRGLASEAAGGMIRFGFDQCGLPTIMATIDPQNCDSVKIVEKLGMRFREERFDEDGQPILVYGIARAGAQA